MPSKKNVPKYFTSPEEAGKFWDTHSAADYWDEMEDAEIEFDIRKHIYQIPVDEKIYQFAKAKADAEHRTVGHIINKILKSALAKAN